MNVNQRLSITSSLRQRRPSSTLGRPVAAVLVTALIVTGIGLAGVAPAAAEPLPANCQLDAATVVCTYGYTGGEQTFTVPVGVTQLEVTAVGGAGGGNYQNDPAGGQAAVVSGMVPVPADTTVLYVQVGGNGTSGREENPVGGFNGGGSVGGFYSGAGGGGGASDVRSTPRVDPTSLDSRLVVAGGGGGSGADGNTEGAGGGGAAGLPGIDGAGGPLGGKGGGAGGATAGGAGGAGGSSTLGSNGENGAAGELGQGGGAGVRFRAGGGGGGGLYGGGGGGASAVAGGVIAGGGGGGGSSLVPAGGTVGLTGAAASVVIRYAATAPVITVQPGSVAVLSGGSASFTAAADGVPAPSVRWQRAESRSDVFVDVAGATATTLTTPPVTPGDDGAQFRAVFSNAAGETASEPARLTVLFRAGAPTVTSLTPGDGQLVVAFTPGPVGNPLATTFEVSATPASQQPPGAPPAQEVFGIPTTSTTVTLTGLVNGAAYVVTVAAVNPVGGTTSAPSAPVVVGVPPTVTGTPPGGAAGAAYSYQFTVAGAPAPTVTVVSGTLPPGLALSSSGVLSGTPTTVGSYPFTVRATNALGTADLATSVTVAAGPAASITADGGSGQSAAPGAVFGAPLTARVVDGYGNPVPGAAVTFTVTSGSASFAGSPTVTATTNASGVASAALTAGTTPGPVTVTATTAGVGGGATFLATVTANTPARADLQVTITGPATLNRDASGEYTIKVTNRGPAAATSVLTGAAVSRGLTITAAPGGTVAYGAALWRAQSIAPGATVTYRFTARAGTTPTRAVIGAITLAATPDSTWWNNITATSTTTR